MSKAKLAMKPAQSKALRRTAARVASRASSSPDLGAEEDDQAAMLAALQAQSRRMLGLDGPDEAESSAQTLRRSTTESIGSGAGISDDEDDSESDDFREAVGEDDDFDDEWNGIEEVRVTQDANGQRVPEVIFASGPPTADQTLSKADRRAFMNGSSRKIMGLAKETDYTPRTKRKREEEGDPEDQDNMKLDRTLHSMLLNSLISTSTAEVASRPSEKRKAVSARLLELAQYSLPGEGSTHSSLSDLSKHPAKVRNGLVKAQEARVEKKRAEAQAAEGWVRGPKGAAGKKGRDERRLGVGMEVGRKKGMEKLGKERGRGLGMGVGRFEGGMLKLSEREIRRGNGESSGRGGKRGRGGRGGRGGRRH